MAGTVEQKLADLGVKLHEPVSPVANYVGFVRTGNLLFVSGQICMGADGQLIAKGKLGAGVTLEQGVNAARGCAINILAQVKAALGDLDKVAASSVSAASSTRRRISSTRRRSSMAHQT